MQKKIETKFFVFEISVSELVVLNCLYYADIACHWLPMCEQTVLGFSVSLKETFWNAFTLKVINNFGKIAFIQIGTIFWPICHVLCLRVLWNTAF